MGDVVLVLDADNRHDLFACSISATATSDDRNVPFQQTTDLVEKPREQKVAFEELIFPEKNPRPAPLERLDPVVPRLRRILRPQTGWAQRTAISRLRVV